MKSKAEAAACVGPRRLLSPNVPDARADGYTSVPILDLVGEGEEDLYTTQEHKFIDRLCGRGEGDFQQVHRGLQQQRRRGRRRRHDVRAWQFRMPTERAQRNRRKGQAERAHMPTVGETFQKNAKDRAPAQSTTSMTEDATKRV